MENKVNDIKCYLLDMDGTIYLGDKLIDGAKEFLQLIKNQDKRYIFLTNNSSKNRLSYIKKLKGLGIDVVPDDVFTSGEATCIYLNQLKPKAKVFLLGTPLLEKEFIEEGFNLIKDREEKPDFVVIGFDTTLTYEKLWRACDFIREGVKYVATHPDYNCPLDNGRFMPDAGAIIDFIHASTGKRPYIVGKPNLTMIDMICKKYDVKKEDLAMVGDRLYTDIKIGENAGITSILVLSGETTLDDYNNSDINATYVYPSILNIIKDL